MSKMSMAIGRALAVATLLSIVQQMALADLNPASVKLIPSDFQSLLWAVNKLESVEMKVTPDSSQETIKDRNQLLKLLMLEDITDRVKKFYYEESNKVSSFEAAALKYRSSDQPAFFKLFRLDISPMKSISKDTGYLSELVDKYVKLKAKGVLDDSTIEKDLQEYKDKVNNDIMTVVDAYIKYLVVEDVQLINGALLKRLEKSKLIVHNNYYSITINDEHRKVLLNFYASEIDPDKVNVAEAEGHYVNVGRFRVGALLESCSLTENPEVNPWTESLNEKNQNSGKYKTVDFCQKFTYASV